MASKPGLEDSEIISQTYEIQPRVQRPVFVGIQDGGDYLEKANASVTSATEVRKALYRYTFHPSHIFLASVVCRGHRYVIHSAPPVPLVLAPVQSWRMVDNSKLTLQALPS